ncbi:ADAM 17-like protease, partial [Saccostrea cucullata]
LGHNWGSEHDPDTDSCAPSTSSGGRYIMYPSAVSGYEKNNQLFSPCSRQYIFNVIKTKGYNCFKEASATGQGLCGNGRVDKNEDCDAGYTGDRCCNDKCQFRAKYMKCSPMNFACCVNCTVAPIGYTCLDQVDDNFDCKGKSHCSGKDLTCPNAVPKTDNTSCHNGFGKCWNGKCLDACQQVKKNPCLCKGDDACKTCCFKPNTEICEPLSDQSEQFLEDGRPCYDGFCKKGKCEKSQSKLVQRLFSIIQSFSIDQIALFMKNNIVWTVLILAIPVWILGIYIINKFDEKEEIEDQATRNPKRDVESRGKVLPTENRNIITVRRSTLNTANPVV